jgi:hypothetical protein
LQAVRELLDGLAACQARPEGPYTFQDETRDFRSVFGTDSGKRVLSMIAQICDPRPVPDNTISNAAMLLAKNEGRRSVMHEIMLRYAGRGAPAQQGTENE